MTDTELTKWLIGYLRDEVADLKGELQRVSLRMRNLYTEEITNLEAAIALLEGQKRG